MAAYGAVRNSTRLLVTGSVTWLSCALQVKRLIVFGISPVSVSVWNVGDPRCSKLAMLASGRTNNGIILPGTTANPLLETASLC